MSNRNKKCWICNGEGLEMSGEHKVKAADLKRFYGKNLESVDELAMYSGNNDPINIKRVSDNILKFPKVICKNCNNIRTHKHDKAYDRFVEYATENSQTILEKGFVDYKVVFGSDWKYKKRCLFKYFAKHAGCKVVTSNFPHNVENLGSFINSGSPPSTFTLKMESNVNIHLLSSYNNERNVYHHLYNGETIYYAFNKTIYSFSGFVCNGIMTFHWFVAPRISPINLIDFDNQIENIPVIYKESEPPEDAKTNMHSYVEWVHTKCYSDRDIRNWIALNT